MVIMVFTFICYENYNMCSMFLSFGDKDRNVLKSTGNMVLLLMYYNRLLFINILKN